MMETQDERDFGKLILGGPVSGAQPELTTTPIATTSG